MTLTEAHRRVLGAMDRILWGENQPQWVGAFGRARGQIKIDPACKTAKITDKGAITIGQKLAESLPIKQLGYVVAHEVSHPMLDHFQRMPAGADADAWNVAGDVVINEAICTDGGDDALPDWVVRKPAGYTGPMAVEPIYAWLRRNPDQAPKPKRGEDGEVLPGAGCGAIPDPEEGAGEGGESESAEWGRIAIQARALEAASKGRGNGSAICAALAPSRPYYTFAQLLRYGARQADASVGREVRSYARMARRDHGDGIVLPGNQGGVPNFAIVVDASGSMNRGWIARIGAEIAQIAREFASMRFYLIVHTSSVVWEGWITSKGASKAIPEALAFSGGTYVTPAYTRLAEICKRWDSILHFTDCEVETPWPHAPTRRLIVGAFGLGAFSPMSMPPAGATVIPCRDP